MLDAEFNSLLESCNKELVRKQMALQARIAAASSWHYELENCSIAVDDTCYPMIPLGTFDSVNRLWRWAWATKALPDFAPQALRQLQDLYQKTGLQIFCKPGSTVSNDDVKDLVALSVHQLDSIGFFRCPFQGPTITLYLTIQDA